MKATEVHSIHCMNILQFLVIALTDGCACFSLPPSHSLFLFVFHHAWLWHYLRSPPQMRNRMEPRRHRKRRRELQAVCARRNGTATCPHRADISLTDVRSERGTSVTRQSDNHQPQHGYSPSTLGRVCARNGNEALLRGRWGQWSVQSWGIQFGSQTSPGQAVSPVCVLQGWFPPNYLHIARFLMLLKINANY